MKVKEILISIFLKLNNKNNKRKNAIMKMLKIILNNGVKSNNKY